MERKSKVTDKVDGKIKTVTNKSTSKFRKSAFQQGNPLDSLTDIHNQFVVTPIDKDNGNVGFYLF